MHSNKPWIIFTLILILILFALLVDIPRLPKWLPLNEWFTKQKVHLGLDLQGGTQLIYLTETKDIPSQDKDGAVVGGRDVIERRINIFGVAEPVIQTAKAGDEWKIIVELPGIKNVSEAIKMIGETPILDFREQKQEAENVIKEKEEKGEPILWEEIWTYTGLTGKHLKTARIDFNPQTNEPLVALEFNDEGTKLFAEITKRNVNKPVAIFLDGLPISIPVVKEEITGGKAVITGKFTLKEAKELAQRLRAGALPVPITLVSQQNIGPSLGKISIEKSFMAGIIGFLLVIIFMIIFYRRLGLIASFALIIYTFLVLAIFKLLPVTLTLAGIAGFILSIGMAVDANVLIFERIKDEERLGKTGMTKIEEGFSHAWTAIRDSNFTTLIICFILYQFGTGLVRGFGLTLGLGVLVSMFTAIVITKTIIKLTTRY